MTEWFVLKEFKELGSRIYTIIILMIIATAIGLFIPIIDTIIRIIALVYLIMAMGNIKRIDKQLNNKNFGEFRTKFIQSIILEIIGYMVFSITISVMLAMLSITGDIFVILYALPVLIVAGIIILVSIAIQKKAWHELHKFFENNPGMFPEYLTGELLEATDKLEDACKYLLLFFLIITVIIAAIYFIIGYFKLAKLKDLNIQQGQQTPQGYNTGTASISPTAPLPAADAPSGGDANFCPGCGHKLEGNPKFCTLCGEKIE